MKRVREAETRLVEYWDALQVLDDSVPEEPVLDFELVGNDRAIAVAAAFLLTQSDSASVYGLLKSTPEDMPVDKALYVNSWLLHCLRSSTNKVGNLVAEHKNYNLELEPKEFKHEVLEKWLQDETVHTFDFSRFANGSHDYSIAAISGKTPNSRPASENALQNDQQNTTSLQRRLSARQTETER